MAKSRIQAAAPGRRTATGRMQERLQRRRNAAAQAAAAAAAPPPDADSGSDMEGSQVHSLAGYCKRQHRMIRIGLISLPVFVHLPFLRGLIPVTGAP